MTPTAYRERIDETSEALAWLRDGLDEEEREHLALELLDVTRRGGDAYKQVIGAWTLTLIARTHPSFPYQVKEYENLVQSGELAAGIDFGAISRIT
jgi:hypothetical protein